MKLIFLNLLNVPLHGDFAKAICEFLTDNNETLYIDVSKCDIDNQGMVYISEGLKRNKVVEKFRCNWNNASFTEYTDFNGEGIRSLSNALVGHPTIRDVTLSQSNLNALEATEMIGLLIENNKTIKTLDIGLNNFNGDTFRPIAKALAKNTTIKVLTITDFPFENEIFKVLYDEALLDNVGLSEIHITSEFIKSGYFQEFNMDKLKKPIKFY